MQSAFQVTCPSGLRHAETRILVEQPSGQNLNGDIAGMVTS